MNAYDLIGDVHGHCDTLIRLLETLGYDRRRGHYSHPQRKAVFVGDLIDRGPKIRETLELVRDMVDRGAALAVMGNHEFNAIAYHTRHPDDPSTFLRKRIAKNVRQHFDTVQQVPPHELYEILDWFRRLPMWLDLGDLRVVHACWNVSRMEGIEKALKAFDGVSDEFMQSATDPDSDLFEAVEVVLKGPELELPEGVVVRDKDGHVRRKVRAKWFLPAVGLSLSEYAFGASAIAGESESGIPLDESAIIQADGYQPDAPPVFFGHYWLQGEKPYLLAPNVACLDFSVAKDGFLCCYRWDGERELQTDKLVWV